MAANRGTILFVGTKRQARDIVAEEARRTGMPYVEQEIIVRDGQISGVDTAVNISSKPGKTNAGAVK